MLKIIKNASFYQSMQFSKVLLKGNGNELWVLILEKAWAKVYESYERIESGHTGEVLRALTGAPVKSVFTYSKNLWEEIQSSW